MPSGERPHPVGHRNDGGGFARIELFHHVVIQLSKPSRIICSGNSRPMKTTRLSRALAVLPLPLMIAFQHHVHALEHVAVVIVGEGQDALRAQDLLALAGDEVLQPRHEFGRIERLVGAQRQRLHLLVVVVLQPAMAVAVIVVMIMAVMMIVVMVMIVIVAGLEEFRLDFEDAVEIERAALQHVRQRHLAALGAVQLGVGVDAADARLDLGEFGLGDEIGLVQHDDVGERDLVLGFRRVLQAVAQPFGVGDGHDRIEPGVLLHVLVDEEGLRHRRRIGEARGLDDDGVELALALHQPVHDAHEVAAHGAADAAIVHLEHFFVGADDEVVVDADLAEFVDDDGVFLAVVFRQDAVEQRGLAGAEIARQHGHGNFLGRKFWHNSSGGGTWARAGRQGGPCPIRRARSSGPLYCA